ncbi:MAG: LytR/AlgR family response regulator transcription factor [Janthinobacterium lividum]
MLQPEPMRVLVVDDEPPARRRIVDLLNQDASVGHVTEAEDGDAAVRLILDRKLDLVFLDVQMPLLDGLGVIRQVGAACMPPTIFVTAYDRHAVRAFEDNALDYLLKPFSDERFDAAMARVRARRDEGRLRTLAQDMIGMLSGARSGVPPHERFLDRLVLKTEGTARFVRVEDVELIEAAGVYVNLYIGGSVVLHRASLTDLAERLDPARFVRVHRSAIVNLDSILRLEPISHGEFDVVLKRGQRCRISRTYRTALEKRLGQSL